jgi:hypothetical protein
VRRLRSMLQETAVRRGLAILALGAVIGLAPMVALANDYAGGTMVGTAGAGMPAPAWQVGNAQGDGNGR